MTKAAERLESAQHDPETAWCRIVDGRYVIDYEAAASLVNESQPQGTELWQVLAICPQSVDHQGEQAWYQSFKMPAGVDRDGALDFALAGKAEFPHEGSPCPVHGPGLMKWSIQKIVTYVAEQEDDI